MTVNKDDIPLSPHYLWYTQRLAL